MKKAEGIVVFGPNGTGKTTLGRELASKLGFRHMDAEDYFFEKSDVLYQTPRAKADVIRLMLDDIDRYGSFVLTGVTGNYGDEIASLYKLAIFLSAPVDLRMERIRKRAIDKHGNRARPNGDLYESSENFISFARNRDLSAIDRWAETLKCPIVQIDASKPLSQCVQAAMEACAAR